MKETDKERYRMLEDQFRRYLANAAYSIWEMNTEDDFMSILPYMDMDECDASDLRKKSINAKLRTALGKGLVNRYLFPDYDRYGTLLTDYLTDSLSSDFSKWSEPVQMLRSCHNPEGGFFYKKIVTLPEHLFSGIEGCFFDRIRYSITCIRVQNPDPYYWYNILEGYDRRQTLHSWNGEKFGCLYGNGGTVMDVFAGMDEARSTVSFILGQILTAYCDFSRMKEDRFYQGSFSRRRTKRFSENIEHLLCRSDETCPREMGEVLKGLSDIEKRLTMPYEFISDAGNTLGNYDFNDWMETPEDIIYIGMEMMRDSDGYYALKTMEDKLNEFAEILDDYPDEHRICEYWNRCVKQKVTTREEIMSRLNAKFDAVKNSGLLLLSQYYYHTFNSSYIKNF